MNIIPLHVVKAEAISNAWRLSRDAKAYTPLEEILKVDAPVLEMATGVFHFVDFTILEREIFTSARDHCIWARTSRVDDPALFTVPPGTIDLHKAEEIRATMQHAAKTQPQDTWRMLLPLAAHTNWTAQMNLRAVIKMAKYFDWLSYHVPDKGLVNRFANVHRELLMYAALALVPRENDFMIFNNDHIKMDNYLNVEPLTQATGNRLINDFYYMNCTMPIALRAQVVRHRRLLFADDLFALMQKPDVLAMDLNTKINMELAATTDYWHSIAAKRNCWISQTDLWAPVLANLTDDILPCSGGAPCPCGADNDLRMAGKDPNPVCPIYTRRKGIDNTPWRAAQHIHAADRAPFWQTEIEGVKGE